MEPGDLELVRRIRAGDRNALDLLVRRWYPRVYGYVVKRLGSEEEAGDVTQEVFLAMLQNLDRWRPWKKFENWLFTIARNRCVDWFRTRGKQLEREDPGAEPEGRVPSPEDQVVLQATLQQALERLPPRQREVMELQYLYQLTAPEIARLTDTPLPTVKSRMSAARKALKAMLKEDFL